MELETASLTSNGTGPDDGVASPMPFAGVPLLHLLSLKSVARSGARSLSIPLRQVLSEISVAREGRDLLSHELFWGVDPDGFGQG